MDYAALPPEITSALLRAGAGSGPFLAAAQAWTATYAGLTEAAEGYRAVIASIPWYGPSSAAMRASALAYAAWLTTTAAQAETTANQALAAVAAYETAFAATVPPPVIAANRALLAALAATNLFGQNTAAIAATEAQYAEFWAQDAAAMYGYAASSAAATQLTPFSPAPQTATPLAVLPQRPAAQGIGQILSGLLSSSSPGDLLNSYAQSFLSSGPYELPISLLSIFSGMFAMGPGSPLGNALLRLSASAEGGTAAPVAEAISAPTVTASMGTAVRSNLLRVPPNWARPPGVLPAPAPPGVVAPSIEEMPTPFPLPMGAPRGGTPPKQEKPPPEYGTHGIRFIPQTPAGG